MAAEALARLGQIWLNKGKAVENKSREESDPIKKEELNLQQVEMYRTAAQKFARVNEQFPEHELCGKAKVLSGQCYMRAKDMDHAAEAFAAVAAEKTAAPELIAEAMYWLGDGYYRSNKAAQAYRTFKVLTWDYPETTWAKYARGRLSEKEFQNMDNAGEDVTTNAAIVAKSEEAQVVQTRYHSLIEGKTNAGLQWLGFKFSEPQWKEIEIQIFTSSTTAWGGTMGWTRLRRRIATCCNFSED